MSTDRGKDAGFGMVIGPGVELAPGLRPGLRPGPRPGLRLAMSILLAPSFELRDRVAEELDGNPLVEWDEEPRVQQDGAIAEGDSLTETDDDLLARDPFSGIDDVDLGDVEPYDDLGPGWAKSRPESLTDWSLIRGVGRFDEVEGAPETVFTQHRSLKDHLRDQLPVAGLSASQWLIAMALVDGIDENGYLRVDIGDLADQLNANAEDVLTVLGIVQGCEPTGVGARNLAECLSLQLREIEGLDAPMEILLRNLDKVAKQDLAYLSTICGVDREQVIEMIGEIHGLAPKPGLAFGTEPIPLAIPDVIARPSRDGHWRVEFNSDSVPPIRIDRAYYGKMLSRASSREDRKALRKWVANAKSVKRNLATRENMILNVAREIVKNQADFLNRGINYLRPMTLKMVAEALGVHGSTVSRATTNKYIDTPRGVFELKYFFSKAIPSGGDDAPHSAEAVRDRIRKIVDDEGPKALSDERIAMILSADGPTIARRTVVKYRGMLGIPSSADRRRRRQWKTLTKAKS